MINSTSMSGECQQKVVKGFLLLLVLLLSLVASTTKSHSLLPRILSLLKGLNGWNQCLGFMTLQELHKDHEGRFLIMEAYRLNTMPGVNNDVETEMLLLFVNIILGLNDCVYRTR